MKKMLSIYEDCKMAIASPLGIQARYYLYFYAIICFVHLIIISIVSYFHLLLGHNISTIGDWIVDRGWTLIIISKLLVFVLVYQFVRLKGNYLILIKNYFKNAIQWPRQEMYVSLLFLLFGLVSLGNIQWNSALIFEFDRVFLSILGTFAFFAFDYVFLIALELIIPLSEESKKIRIVLFSFLFYLFTYITFQYEQIISLKLFAYFFLLQYLGGWRRTNWTLPFLFLVFFIMPAFTLFGLDPVWGHSFTLFKMIKQISTASVFILIIFSTGYLQFRLKNKKEYIFRE